MNNKKSTKLIETIIEHEVKKRLVKEMARTQEWFPLKNADVWMSPKYGSKRIKVDAVQNEKRYPGLAYASTPDHKFIIFHIKSGKPIFYNIANEPLARKLLKQTTKGVEARGKSWNADESEIMSNKNSGIFFAVVKKVKKQNSPKTRGKWD